jgi:long-subunit fatty acid transport protein
MRLQPSLGIAYRPNDDNELSKNGNQYEYKPGNWNTALVSALGFEFAKGVKRLFTLSLFHTKGLDGEETQSISTVSNGKNNITYLESESSGWGMSVGIPFNLTKKKPVAVRSQQHQKTSSHYNIKKCSKAN